MEWISIIAIVILIVAVLIFLIWVANKNSYDSGGGI